MKLIQTFKDRHGKIQLFFLENEKAFLAKPKGFINSRLLLSYLSAVKKMDQLHTDTYDHIVDTSEVSFAHPLNPFHLRTIKRLKNADKYIVIVPNPFLRFLVKLTRWVNKPDLIFNSMQSYKVFLKHNQLER